MEKIQLNSKVSKRYGKALFKITQEQAQEQKTFDEINDLLKTFNSDKKFSKIFFSPLLNSKSQMRLVNNLFSNKDKKKLYVSKNIFSFLKVLAQKGRLKALFGALYYFINLVKSMRKEVNVYLTTAIPINDVTKKSITNILAQKTDNVDKNIIGGIILSSGSNLIDASIKNKMFKINSITKGVN